MRYPTLHLNGSSANTLQENYTAAVRALKNALFKLEETRPHGRDYYVQNDASSQDASSEAMTEHLSRTYRLTQVLNELNYILDKIESQIDEKEKRKNE